MKWAHCRRLNRRPWEPRWAWNRSLPRTGFLIGAAVLSLLSAAAGDRPLLCLVDDAGWLDYESAVALAFAARRLEAEAVVVIVAARSRRVRHSRGSRPARSKD